MVKQSFNWLSFLVAWSKVRHYLPYKAWRDRDLLLFIYCNLNVGGRTVYIYESVKKLHVYSWYALRRETGERDVLSWERTLQGGNNSNGRTLGITENLEPRKVTDFSHTYCSRSYIEGIFWFVNCSRHVIPQIGNTQMKTFQDWNKLNKICCETFSAVHYFSIIDIHRYAV